MTAELFDRVSQTPAVQTLCRCLEAGGALSCHGVSPAAQPFFTVLLQRLFPHRPIVAVTIGLRNQEGFHQDVQTWLNLDAVEEFKVQNSKFKVESSNGAATSPQSQIANRKSQISLPSSDLRPQSSPSVPQPSILNHG